MNPTKQEIMKLGEMLIRTKGYHSFSYADISKPLEIKNAAVHYHFPTKTDLGVAIIEATIQDFVVLCEQVKNQSPMDKLIAFISIYDRSKSMNRVCIVGALSPSYDSLPEEMQVKLHEVASSILLWLSAVLEEGKTLKVFQFTEDASTKAHAIISSLLASLLLQKVLSDQAFETIKQSILISIKY